MLVTLGTSAAAFLTITLAVFAGATNSRIMQDVSYEGATGQLIRTSIYPIAAWASLAFVSIGVSASAPVWTGTLFGRVLRLCRVALRAIGHLDR